MRIKRVTLLFIVIVFSLSIAGVFSACFLACDDYGQAPPLERIVGVWQLHSRRHYRMEGNEYRQYSFQHSYTQYFDESYEWGGGIFSEDGTMGGFLSALTVWFFGGDYPEGVLVRYKFEYDNQSGEVVFLSPEGERMYRQEPIDPWGGTSTRSVAVGGIIVGERFIMSRSRLEHQVLTRNVWTFERVSKNIPYEWINPPRPQ